MSNDEKRYTEKDLILAKRDAYTRAAHAHCQAGCPSAAITEAAKLNYPLPKIRRPRVVEYVATDGGVHKLRARDEVFFGNPVRVIETSRDGQKWGGFSSSIQISERTLPICADLLANPTETVDAE